MYLRAQMCKCYHAEVPVAAAGSPPLPFLRAQFCCNQAQLPGATSGKLQLLPV